MVLSRKNINKSNYNFTDADNIAEDINGKRLYDNITDADNITEDINGKRLWTTQPNVTQKLTGNLFDIDYAKNDIIKRGQ